MDYKFLFPRSAFHSLWALWKVMAGEWYSMCLCFNLIDFVGEIMNNFSRETIELFYPILLKLYRYTR